MDDSTDTTDNAQLLVFVSFYDEAKGEFVEDVLGLQNVTSVCLFICPSKQLI